MPDVKQEITVIYGSEDIDAWIEQDLRSRGLERCKGEPQVHHEIVVKARMSRTRLRLLDEQPAVERRIRRIVRTME